MRPLRATWTEELQKEIFKIQREWTIPNLIAEEICSVQPMVDIGEFPNFSFKILKARKVNWNKGFYYAPYLPLEVYPEQKEFLKDEDILI